MLGVDWRNSRRVAFVRRFCYKKSSRTFAPDGAIAVNGKSFQIFGATVVSLPEST